MLGAWGVLPIAVALLVFVTERLTRLVFGDATRGDRAAGAVVIAMGVVHLCVGWLAQLGVLSRASLLGLLGVAALALAFATRTRPVPSLPRLGGVAVAVLAAIAVVLVLAVVTARILPVWQWDSIGYHLPFVQFVVQSGSFDAVPRDVRYISTYPHDIELAMVWLRLMLPDDRLVDLAQVPFGLGGAVLTAAIARRLGASLELALLAAAAWLVAPGVFLQLPTNYVDVGTAAALLGALYFLVLSPLGARNLVVGGIALGLFLGSKPSAPLATAFVGALVLLRAWKGQRPRHLVAFGLAVLVFGGEMYVVMLLRHGNPVWPVELKLGPWTLPGESTVEALLASGAANPRAQGSLLERLTLSWLAIDTPPVFDMRLGGFGALFLLALPLALAGLVRRRDGWLAGALVASLLSADAGVTRYSLGFAALVFALALAEVSRMGARLVPAAVGVVLAMGGAQLGHAWPGLVGDGPSWLAFWAMSDEERREALGPAGRPIGYAESWARVGAGESAAFDTDFEFPGLLWSPRSSYPVHLVPKSVGEGLGSWLDQNRVRLVAVGPTHQARLEQHAEQWAKLFDCQTAPCAVYLRR
jgi:hypothetical protein